MKWLWLQNVCMGLTSFTVSMKIGISFRPEESKKLRTHFLVESHVNSLTNTTSQCDYCFCKCLLDESKGNSLAKGDTLN